MRRSRPTLLMMIVAAAVLLPVQEAQAAGGAVAVDLGAAAPFAVLGGSTVTNAGATMVTGDLGVSPGTAVTITPDKVNGTIYAGGPVAAAAKADMITAYNTALAQGPDAPLAGDLGGMTLTPGLYSFGAAATLGSTLTLNGGGDPNAVFIFQIGSTITTAANSAVVLTGGAQACHVTWLIGSSATLGAATTFRGDVLADVSITAVAGTTVEGRLLAKSGAVTLSAPQVTPVGPASPTIFAGPYTIDAGSPVSIASAAAGAGMGTYTLAATPLTLALPADVYADSYTSTITISVVSGP